MNENASPRVSVPAASLTASASVESLAQQIRGAPSAAIRGREKKDLWMNHAIAVIAAHGLRLRISAPVR